MPPLVSGYIDASTTNGGVEVGLAQHSESDIKLACPNRWHRTAATAIKAICAHITNGGIDTSGLELETTGERSRRDLDFFFNGGGARIDLEGTNGGIRIAGR